MSVEKVFRELAEIFRKKGLKSSLRIAIMIYLFFKRSVYFSDLIEALNVTPGNLWSHLEKLRNEGLIEVKYVISDRPRTTIKLTEKGYNVLIDLFHNLIIVLEEYRSRKTNT